MAFGKISEMVEGKISSTYIQYEVSVTERDIRRGSFRYSMPAALLSTTPQGRSVRHRLIYQALSPDQESRAEKVIKLEIVISLPREHENDKGAQEVQLAEEVQQTEEIQPSFQSACSFGTETALDMLLPDRYSLF
jgi:hypothetical protein